jgi:hypothetical protein
MRIHTNTKLYGGDFLQDVENFFDLHNEKYIIDTWKVLVSHKKHDRLGYWDELSDEKKSRYENVLWRKWHMNSKNSSRIDFDMGLIPQSKFTGRIVIITM